MPTMPMDADATTAWPTSQGFEATEEFKTEGWATQGWDTAFPTGESTLFQTTLMPTTPSDFDADRFEPFDFGAMTRGLSRYDLTGFGATNSATMTLTATQNSQDCPSTYDADTPGAGCWDLSGTNEDGAAICTLVADAQCVGLSCGASTQKGFVSWMYFNFKDKDGVSLKSQFESGDLFLTLGPKGEECYINYQADIDGFAFELELGQCGMTIAREAGETLVGYHFPLPTIGIVNRII